MTFLFDNPPVSCSHKSEVALDIKQKKRMPLTSARGKGLGVRRKHPRVKQAYNNSYHGTRQAPIVLTDSSSEEDACSVPGVIVISDSDATQTMPSPPPLSVNDSSFLWSYGSTSSINTTETALDDDNEKEDEDECDDDNDDDRVASTTEISYLLKQEGYL